MLKEEVIKNIEYFNSESYQNILREKQEIINVINYDKVKQKIIDNSEIGESITFFGNLDDYSVEKLEQEGFYVESNDDEYDCLYGYYVHLDNPNNEKTNKYSLFGTIIWFITIVSIFTFLTLYLK